MSDGERFIQALETLSEGYCPGCGARIDGRDCTGCDRSYLVTGEQ